VDVSYTPKDVVVSQGQFGLLVRPQFRPFYIVQEVSQEERMCLKENELRKDLQDLEHSLSRDADFGLRTWSARLLRSFGVRFTKPHGGLTMKSICSGRANNLAHKDVDLDDKIFEEALDIIPPKETSQEIMASWNM
jgi:hypothetical protein